MPAPTKYPDRLFATFFFTTGIFAIVGALYTWGEGPLWQQDDLLKSLLPWADLIFTGPFSLLVAFGLWKQKKWGKHLGSVTTGAYLMGSFMVGIILVWEGPPYPWQMIVPPVVGVLASAAYVIWVIRD